MENARQLNILIGETLKTPPLYVLLFTHTSLRRPSIYKGIDVDNVIADMNMYMTISARRGRAGHRYHGEVKGWLHEFRPRHCYSYHHGIRTRGWRACTQSDSMRDMIFGLCVVDRATEFDIKVSRDSRRKEEEAEEGSEGV